MPKYEYKVVPAPKKPGKIKGVKGTDNKFAAELAGLMNEFGADGWEYQRTDTLPCEERQGLTGRTTTFQNMLIFRRNLDFDTTEIPPESTDVATPIAATEEVLSMPSFRATAPAATAALPSLSANHDIPEGAAPQIGSTAQ